MKYFEIRDRGTFIPAVAVKLEASNEQDRYLLRRSGFGDKPEDFVVLTKLQHPESQWDHYDWGNRTMTVAHNYIKTNWDLLESGAVVDVQYILHETTEPKVSENENAVGRITETQRADGSSSEGA